MSYEYLVASLPMCFFGEPPPMSTAELRARCAEQLNGRDLATLDRLLASAGDPDAPGFEGAWTARERQLRAAIAAARAPRYGADPRAVRPPHPGWDQLVETGVADAFALPTPLEREQALDRVRWHVLEELTPRDPFTAEAIFVYALKLRIAERWAARSDDQGRQRFDEALAALLRGAAPESVSETSQPLKQVS